MLFWELYQEFLKQILQRLVRKVLHRLHHKIFQEFLQKSSKKHLKLSSLDSFKNLLLGLFRKIFWKFLFFQKFSKKFSRNFFWESFRYTTKNNFGYFSELVISHQKIQQNLSLKTLLGILWKFYQEFFPNLLHQLSIYFLFFSTLELEKIIGVEELANELLTKCELTNRKSSYRSIQRKISINLI